MKFRCPIHKNYIQTRSYDANKCITILTQYFGENKNAFFYGAEGH